MNSARTIASGGACGAAPAVSEIGAMRARTARRMRPEYIERWAALVDVPAVVDVGGNVVADVDAAEQLEQLGIVGLQILRRLEPRGAVLPLVVGPEPPLRAFGPVLVGGG